MKPIYLIALLGILFFACTPKEQVMENQENRENSGSSSGLPKATLCSGFDCPILVAQWKRSAGGLGHFAQYTRSWTHCHAMHQLVSTADNELLV